MNILFIKELSIFTKIGIYPWEKKIKQKILIDIKIAIKNIDFTEKKIKNFIDYEKISKILIEKLEKKSFLLIEEIAEKTAKIIFHKNKCLWIEIKIQKPTAILRAKSVGFIIKRKFKYYSNKKTEY